MAEETNNAPAAKGGIGHIVRVVGPVVDVEFAPSEMPAIYNALRIDADTPIGHIKLVMEVQMHLPGDLVRAVAMSSTDGLTRGLEVQDTGAPMMMPVGPETLGRIWNVVGEPVDGKPMPDIKEMVADSIVRHLLMTELTTTTEIFETGIKSIDLIEPSSRVARRVCSAALVLVRPLSFRNSSTTSLRSMVVLRYSPV